MKINLKQQLKEANLLYQKNTRYFAFYADMLFENGKIRKAEKIVEKNFENYSDYLSGYLTYAKILIERDKLDKATEILRKAIEIDTRCVSAYKLLGDIEIIKTNSHDHLQYYSEVMRYDPFNIDIKNIIHILEKKFDTKSEDDILSRYYSDKDINLPKIPNSERDNIFSKLDNKNIKNLERVIDRSDKQKADSIIDDISSKMESEEIETVPEKDIKAKNSVNKIVSEINNFTNENQFENYEKKQETEDAEESLSKISISSNLEDINIENINTDKKDKVYSIKIDNDQKEKKNDTEIRENKIATVSKVINTFKESFEIDNKNEKINNENKTYQDFFKSSKLENNPVYKRNENEQHSSSLTDYANESKPKNKNNKRNEDSFINRFFESQIDSTTKEFGLPAKVDSSESEELNVHKEASESRVDFNELKDTLQKEQEQQNDIQVSEDMREETLQEFYNNKISFNHLPVESEFSSMMNSESLPVLEIEIEKESKDKDEKRFIQHENMELEEIDLIEDNRKEEDKSVIIDSYKDLELEKSLITPDKKKNKIEDPDKVNSKEKLKKVNEFTFNENKILRAYDEIDLLEEERVFKQANDMSSKESDNIKNEVTKDSSEVANNSTGILIDDDKNFKKVVVDKVIGDIKKPKNSNKISIVTPTLGEIYSSQGEFQKSKEVYQKLIQKEPENLKHKINFQIAEYNIAKARITVELDYYKNLLDTHPENQKYKSRFDNFKEELKKIKNETNEKIDNLKKT